MTPAQREKFDRELDRVMSELPPLVTQLLDQVPLVVDDHPSPHILHKLGLTDRRELCGLYQGIPLTKRSVEQSGVPSDTIHIYREGILHLASSHSPHSLAELRRQIRITILHEVGHHFGLEESDLEDVGYG